MELGDYLQDYLTNWSQKITDEIRDNLVSKDVWFDQSSLAQSIQALPVERVEGGYMVRITMADYGKFVDEGRKPTKQGARSLGTTVQRRLAGGDGWIARRGVPVPLSIMVNVKTKSGIKKRMHRFKNIQEANRSLSFAISKKIHSNGFVSKGYGFYSEVVNDFALLELSETLTKNLGQEIEATIVTDTE